MDVYAAVSITGVTTQQKQSAKTPIDFYGCFNPTWNHTVKFSIAEEAVQFTLTVKLFSYWLEDENDLYLGQVTISVQEFLDSNPVQPLTNAVPHLNISYNNRYKLDIHKESKTHVFRFRSATTILRHLTCTSCSPKSMKQVVRGLPLSVHDPLNSCFEDQRTLQKEHTSGLRLCLAIKTRRRKASGERFVKPCFAASRFSTRFQLDSVIESFQTCLIVWFGFVITGIKRLNYAFSFVCLFVCKQSKTQNFVLEIEKS
ncbi:hypothetical protein YC2023_002355 [Brassica napus]